MRKRRACDACRQRKIQCDATSSTQQCNWCSHHGATCTFHKVKAGEKSVSRPGQGFIGDQANQPQRFKNTLVNYSHIVAHPQASITCPSNKADLTSTQHLHPVYAGLLLCQGRDYSGIPFFTHKDEGWIVSRTGERFDFQTSTTAYRRERTQLLSPPRVTTRGVTDPVCVLPPRDIVQACLVAFHQSAFRLAFPVIDYALFLETITVAFGSMDEVSSPRHKTAKACVLAFLSLKALFENEMPILPSVDWDACCDMAHSLLPHIFDEVSLETLQTALMLYLRQRFFGHSDSAAMLHAIACRMAFTLNGHMSNKTGNFGDTPTHQEREDRQIRQLFWHCYIFDNDIALRTGQPPIVSDSHCDLTLPAGYDKSHFSPNLSGGALSSSVYADEFLVPFLPGELRLSRLKHKTCQLLYSAQALNKSDAEVIRAILELDDEIERWRLSIPTEFRPALSISDPWHPVPDLAIPQQMQHVILHLEYHYLIVKIHQASARCGAQGVISDNKCRAVVSTSIALCLEASRSTLFYLKATMDNRVDKAFWSIVFYPTAATITLFLHVLAEPMAPQAQSDLELLDLAVHLINDIPIRRQTPCETSHVQFLSSFINELIRLGTCAISKARRERELEISHGSFQSV